ncbi:DUF308 domain-containing protein [Streptomyces longwoodensis]|uniref:HdeD family acid-resistance protein n=1 Tax=Streptomyces longwoodensis TaxID=68231 RepID=UPI0030E4E1DB|nr:DUF308 domain-containing protein [Streptomyces longwoodensis]
MTVPRGPRSPIGREPSDDGTVPPGSPTSRTTAGAADGPAPPAGTGAAANGDAEGQLVGLSRSWLWLLGPAVATLVPGILALVWPDATLHVLAVLIALSLIVTGAFRFVAAIAPRHGDRFAGLLIAVLYVLAGVLCLRHPLQTVAALALITGAVWLVTGLLTAFTALGTRDLPHRGVVLAVAALVVVAGIVVLALPTESARALTRLLGLWLLLLGLAELCLALALRAALRAPHDGPAPGDVRGG